MFHQSYHTGSCSPHGIWKPAYQTLPTDHFDFHPEGFPWPSLYIIY